MIEKVIARKLVQLDIDNLKEAARAATNAKYIIQEFDGKVFNKRVEERLNQTYARYAFRVKKEEHYFSIYYMPLNDSVSSGVNTTYTQNTREVSVCHVVDKELAEVFYDGKRINAEVLNEHIENKISELMEMAWNLEDDLKKVDKLIQKKEEIVKAAREFNKEIPTFLEYFNLRIRGNEIY